VEMAGLGDSSKAKKQPEPSAPNVGQKRKFLSKWKQEFLWLMFSEENNCMTCSICIQVPGVAGKSQFISDSNSFKKETIQIHGSSNGHLRADSLASQAEPHSSLQKPEVFPRGRKTKRKEIEKR